MKKKVSYFNCTANQAHIGCYAVTDAHFRMLLKNGYDKIHINTKWIGSATIGNKENILELAFSYLKEEVVK